MRGFFVVFFTSKELKSVFNWIFQVPERILNLRMHRSTALLYFRVVVHTFLLIFLLFFKFIKSGTVDKIS